MVEALWLTIFKGVLVANLATLVVIVLVCKYRCRLGWHDLRAVFRSAAVTSPRSGVECIRCFRRWEA